MKIIRILWGKSPHVLNEIPKIPLFEDEIVYVWGTFNNNYLLKLGYKTVLISDKTMDDRFLMKHFAHKIYALEMVENTFDEYLFLDWDVSILKPIDNIFYEKIREGNNIQCPLYAYNLDYKNDIIKYFKDSKKYTPTIEDFFITQDIELNKYHWKYKDHRVIPCTCFFYSRNMKIMNKLLDIIDENNMMVVPDEFSFFIYTNCVLDIYINTYEPIVIRGKDGDRNIEGMEKSIKSINNYIDNSIQKDIYLLHDG